MEYKHPIMITFSYGGGGGLSAKNKSISTQRGFLGEKKLLKVKVI